MELQDDFVRDRLTKAQEEEFALISAIIALSGSAKRSDVLDHVKLEGLAAFSEALEEPNRTKKEARWRTNLSWRRYHLVKSGIMAKKRAVWEVTEHGVEHFQHLSELVQTTRHHHLLTAEAVAVAQRHW